MENPKPICWQFIKKSKLNGQVIHELMDITFAMRSRDVETNAYTLKEVFQKYAFLINEDH